jgi:hypothetical protein
MALLSTAEIDQERSTAFSSIAKVDRFSGPKVLESRALPSTPRHFLAISLSKTATAATTGPAQAPRPASSTPPQTMPVGRFAKSQSRGDNLGASDMRISVSSYKSQVTRCKSLPYMVLRQVFIAIITKSDL